jgi:heme oxygenase
MPGVESITATTTSLPENKLLVLSDKINASTRPLHSQLNRLIINRLPLALPHFYTQGLLHIAPIYITFESLWQSMIHEASQFPTSLEQARFFSPTESESFRQLSNVGDKTHCILTRLYLPGLLRTSRLYKDICSLSGNGEQNVEAELENIALQGAVAGFLKHIRVSIESKPHVLLAYFWVFYMALFSGGRVLRASLQQLHVGEPASSLQFFNFDGNEDGEDLKREFKNRFLALETENILTVGEKEDIVKEAQEIFNSMIHLVFSLDKICHSKAALGQANLATPVQITRHGNLMTLRKTVWSRLDQRRGLVEVLMLALAILVSCYLRWWRYPNP